MAESPLCRPQAALGDTLAARAIALKALHHTASSDVRARCLAIHYPTREDKYVVDDYAIVYLMSPFDLLREGRDRSPVSRVLLVGDADFDSEQNPRKASDEQDVRQSARGHFGRLPGTRREVSDISSLIGSRAIDPVTVLMGTEARESTVRKRSAEYRVIHFATHGWATDRLELGGDDFEEGAARSAADIDAHLLVLEPSLLSGIALVGANRAVFQHGLGPEMGLDDGILTGLESASLVMDSADLVVVSGCDTVGVASAGDSLYGLVSGFRTAGARVVVASLFVVEDDGTAKLMNLFYEAMLTKRAGPAQALRMAALKTKSLGAPPSVWASFVSYGDLSSAPFVLKPAR